MPGFFSQLAFSQPAWLLGIPVGLFILAVVIRRWPRVLSPLSSLLLSVARHSYRHPAYTVLQTLQVASQARHATRNKLADFIAYAVLVGLLFITLSQPYRNGARLPAPEQHRDILFLVDTSLNMTLRDYIVDGKRTSRITMLKQVLRKFVNALHGNRIGLIVFSEQAYYYVPLTSDYALLQYQIQRLRAAVLTGRTSDISHALLYSLRWIRPDESRHDSEKPVLVLISDANRSGRHVDPRAAAAYLAQQHIRLHTIAIGAGSSAGAEKDRLSLIYRPASFYLLKGIAEAGEGEFFWARDEASLQDALRVINQASLREITSTPQYVRIPLYMWPLLAALIWLTLWQILPVLLRRRQ